MCVCVKPRDADKREGGIYPDTSRKYASKNSPPKPKTSILSIERTPNDLAHKSDLEFVGQHVGPKSCFLSSRISQQTPRTILDNFGENAFRRFSSMFVGNLGVTPRLAENLDFS